MEKRKLKRMKLNETDKDMKDAQPSLFHFLQKEAVPSESKPVKQIQKLEKEVDLVKWVIGNESDENGFKLFEDVGQMYELQLAKMEFKTLYGDLKKFRKRTAYFEVVDGKRSYHWYLSNVRGKGQIGHTNQYLTHWFYPYKGKFHGQMIKAIINFMGAEDDDMILDPFMGSGTALIEASTVGTKSIGIEINPALCIVAQIKLDSLSINYPEFESEIKSEYQHLLKYLNQIEVKLNLGG
jgi:tRNA G10  N-methylase Trm11